MKLQILVALFLVASIFGGALVVARQGSDDSVELEKVNPTYIKEAVTARQVAQDSLVSVEAEDIKEIDAADLVSIEGVKYKRSAFPAGHVLSGGVDNANKGFLASVGLLSVALVSDDTNETNKTLKVAAGRIKLRNGEEKVDYKLFASGSNVAESEFSFYVLPKDTRLGNLNDASAKSIGTLKLTRTAKFLGYSSWTARLVLNSGTVAGTYEGKLYGAASKSIRPETQEDRDKEVKDGVGLGRDNNPKPAEQVGNSGSGSELTEAEKQAREINKENASRWREFWKKFFGGNAKKVTETPQTATPEGN